MADSRAGANPETTPDDLERLHHPGVYYGHALTLTGSVRASQGMTSRMHDLGVLFVHGIGTQAQGRTLADWGHTVTDWINRWTLHASPKEGPPAITVGDANLSPADSTQPAHAVVDITTAGLSGPVNGQWILAESWWAATVLPPSYRELVRWSLVVVPWAIASHFILRFRRREAHQVTGLWKLMPLAGNFVGMLVAMVAMPFLLVSLGLVLLIGSIPIPQVRALAGAVQRALANTLGDSLVLIENPLQEAAIVGRVRRDLEWLSPQCKKIVVVAHSQGAAVAQLALRQTRLNNVTLFLTFGSAISKLFETRRLMTRAVRSRWAPWLLSSGAMLLFAGLWGSLSALWAIRDTVFKYGLAYVLLVGLVFAPKVPKWLLIGFATLSLVPLSMIIWPWVDGSPYSFFMLLGAQWPISWGMQAAGGAPAGEALKVPSVDMWMDLHASRDPVSNGPLFEEPYAHERSIEVLNLRSVYSDHNSYWASADDFVSRVACSLAKEAGINLEQCATGDQQRLECARKRRRWRTACLAAVRTAVLMSPFLIVGTQGLTVTPHNWQATKGMPDMPVGLRLQKVATGVVVEIMGALIPDIMKPWLSASAANFSTARTVIGAASLILLVLLVRLGFALIAWRWRAWDRAEVSRLFERKDFRILEPQFIIFLFVSILVVEVFSFAILGWIGDLRVASTGLLGLMILGPLLVAQAAAMPWLFRLPWALFRSNASDLLGVLRRGVSAGTLGFLMALPAFVAAAAHVAGQEPKMIENWHLVERAPWLPLSVVGTIWFVPALRLWRRLEPRVAVPLAAGPVAVPTSGEERRISRSQAGTV